MGGNAHAWMQRKKGKGTTPHIAARCGRCPAIQLANDIALGKERLLTFEISTVDFHRNGIALQFRTQATTVHDIVQRRLVTLKANQYRARKKCNADRPEIIGSYEGD